MDGREADARIRERLRKRALNLVNYAPRTAEELRARLLEKSWARGHDEIVDDVVRDCETRGLIGGTGHEQALRDRLFAYAVDLLARAPRTERDLRFRLSRPVWASPSRVDSVVEALRRYNYINDEEFARRFAENKAASGRSGARRVKLELRAKGITDKETIDRAVSGAAENAPEDEAIDRLVERRMRGRDTSDPRELRRIRDYLLRRGFDPEMVRSRLESLRARHDDDE